MREWDQVWFYFQTDTADRPCEKRLELESECAQSRLHEKCDMELFGFGAVRFLGDEISLGVEGKFRKAPLRGFPPLLLPCL